MDQNHKELAGRSRQLFDALERAIEEKKRAVSVNDVIANLDGQDVSRSMVANYLCRWSVNDRLRGLHQNKRAKNALRSDTWHPHDLLFKQKVGSNVFYERYDQGRHGVWELQPNYRGEPVKVETDPVAISLERAAQAFSAEPVGDEDTREWTIGIITRRRGQQMFRQRLLEAYGAACAITGCNVLDVLEAAHIKPARGQHTMRTDNGLLLRADLHTLFDLGRLWIESDTMTVGVAAVLDGSDYEALRDEPLRAPECDADRPLREHLDSHRVWAKDRPGST